MISFNLEGFKRNRHYLSELLLNLTPDFIFLQELWLPYHERNALGHHYPEYNFQISTPDMFQHPEEILSKPGHVWHGVAIGWRKDIKASIQSLKSTYERAVGVKMTTLKKSLLLVSFYAPTAGNDDDFLESISHLTEYLQANTSHGDQILIGSDSNCSIKSTPRRQNAWKNFCGLFDLMIHMAPLPTFHHHNGTSESSIDIFAASNEINMEDIVQYCTLDTPLNLSSHDPIKATMNVQLEASQDKNKFSQTYSNFERKKIIWDESKLLQYQQLAAKALSDASNLFDAPETTPLLSSLFSTLLVQCATMAFDTKSSKYNDSRHKTPSKKIKRAQETLKHCFRIWKRAGKPASKADPTRSAYCAARASLQRQRRYEDNLQLIKQNHHLMYCNLNNKNQVYDCMKKARGQNSNTTTTILHTPAGTFCGEDVLEGFTADAEHLGKSNEGNKVFDRSFYNLCMLDNCYIFDFTAAEDQIKIQPMNISQLDHILFSKMKLGKACDIYHLTVEHLRHCGLKAKLCILDLINRVLHNIFYLTSPQIKLGLGTAVYKGKNKPASKSSSYRRITVSPILGAIIDYHIDPNAESVFRPHQSPDQLGFTAGISYLLAAVQRGECQRWAIDQKQTCFGVSLDGEAAFPSVERNIQVRELYTVGERGDLLSYSRNTYQNTECHMKLKNKLSRKISEHKGNRQGHVRASGHFKVYINPCLLSLNSSKLGFSIGPICTTAVCVADDTYLFSNTPSGLQGAMDIISHYANRYQLNFNADKTKIVVTGSKADMEFYKETSPWKLNGERVKVVENNEHLGLIVSGSEEEQKNVDNNIIDCRNSVFALLGPAFAFKCLLSPLVQVHLWRTYNLPVLISGLPALPIRPTHMKSLSIFQNKILRGFLKLSNTSPVPSLYFLLGELPVEGLLHIRTLTIFHNIWSNPQTTVFDLVKYILTMCNKNSTTWSNHLQLLCLKYSLPSPLSLLLSGQAWSKESWHCLVKTKVTIWHETELRRQSATNSKMNYLNVAVTGLTGAPHPALRNICTTQDAKKLRVHMKFLTGDFLTNERLSIDQPNTSPACSLCDAPVESIGHVTVACKATNEVRSRLFPELMNVLSRVQPTCGLLQKSFSASILCQFILDCTSLNLPEVIRVPAHNPGISAIFSISRDWCYSASSERSRKLKLLRN